MRKTSLIMTLAISLASIAQAEEVGSVNTSFHFTGSDKIVVEAIKDDGVQGVVCHVSYAKTGGIKGMIGLAEDPSRFSIACRQNGPLVATKNLPQQEEIASFKRSVLFKQMNVARMWDKQNNVLVYLIYSTKLIDGSPYNSISTVPLMPWGTVQPQMK